MSFRGNFITEFRNLNSDATSRMNYLTQASLSNIPIITFVLTNTNLLQKEVINIRLCDSSMQIFKDFQQITIKARESYKFNYDTVGWQWYQGDLFLILNNKGKVKESWQFKKKEYPLGSCPSCHGTKKCRHCNGAGYYINRDALITMCQKCYGTGICQTCDVPIRPNSQQTFNNPTFQSFNSNQNTINNQNTIKYKGRSPFEIQAEIRKCQNEIDSVKRTLLEYDLRKDYGIFYRTMRQNVTKLEHRIQKLYEELDKSTRN